MDGGDSWEEISYNRGLPKGTLGKIGVSLSPAQSGRVWAIIEAEDAGLYRSDDYGESWIRTSKNRDLIHRPWYYCHVFADPKHADTVYLSPTSKCGNPVMGGPASGKLPLPMETIMIFGSILKILIE